MIYLDFIRHGETELLKQGHVLRGRTDDPLTELGYQQMQMVFDENLGRQWQAIFSSPLSRCQNFATDKAHRHALPLFVLDKLQEIDFGDWEGVPTAELHANYPDELALYWQRPQSYTPPNAESVLAFYERIKQAIDEIIHSCQINHIQRPLIICHGGVIKMLYCLANVKPIDQLLSVPVALGEIHHFYYDAGLKTDKIV